MSTVIIQFETYYFAEFPKVEKSTITRLFVGDGRKILGITQIFGDLEPGSIGAVSLFRFYKKLLSF